MIYTVISGSLTAVVSGIILGLFLAVIINTVK